MREIKVLIGNRKRVLAALPRLNTYRTDDVWLIFTVSPTDRLALNRADIDWIYDGSSRSAMD